MSDPPTFADVFSALQSGKSVGIFMGENQGAVGAISASGLATIRQSNLRVEEARLERVFSPALFGLARIFFSSSAAPCLLRSRRTLPERQGVPRFFKRNRLKMTSDSDKGSLSLDEGLWNDILTLAQQSLERKPRLRPSAMLAKIAPLANEHMLSYHVL
jgi:hypothetical protein